MELLLNYIKIVILLSIPQAYINLNLALAIWGLKPQQHIKKLLIFAITLSLITDLDILHVPAEIHILIGTVLTFVIMYLVYRSFGIKKILIVFFSYLFLVILGEMLCVLLIQLTYGIKPNTEMMINHFPMLFSTFTLLWIFLFFLARMIEKRSFLFFHQLYQYLIHFKQSRKKEILLLTFFQAFLLFLLFVIQSDQTHRFSEQSFNYVLYILTLVTFCAFFFTLRLLKRTREEAVRQTQDVYVEEISKMFTAIRGQRHDFLNHVQVMYTMMKMNKHEQLQRYMADLVKESHSVNNVILHNSPAIAAFIQAKSEVAVARSISFTHELSPTLTMETSIKSIDLVKMLGNLIDNAFEESDTLPAEQRWVKLSIQEVNETLIIEISNQGRLLSPFEIQQMLLPGYTTKKACHSGLGLAIVNERIHFYKGTLTIQSSLEKGTLIRVTLPICTK